MPRPSEYYFKEGCFIEEWHNNDADPGCSIARVRVEGGKKTALHSLTNTHERYIMLSGFAAVTVGNETWTVDEGDVVLIEPGVAQQIENLSDQDLIFLAICTPRFDEQNYRAL